MKKILFLLVLGVLFLGLGKDVWAAAKCMGWASISPNINNIYDGNGNPIIKIDGSQFDDGNYKLEVNAATVWAGWMKNQQSFNVSNGVALPESIGFELAGNRVNDVENGYRAINFISSSDTFICTALEYKVKGLSDDNVTCDMAAPVCVSINDSSIPIGVSNCKGDLGAFSGELALNLSGERISSADWQKIESGGEISFTISRSASPTNLVSALFTPGGKTIDLWVKTGGSSGSKMIDSIGFETKGKCTAEDKIPRKKSMSGITIKPKECNSGAGLETALGCIPTDPQALIGWILKTAISIGGGVAFLLMLWGGFLLSTSTGNPEKIKQGQEILTSAIVGLLFIIFSVFLLSFIGFDILKIPGFKKV